MVLYQYSYLYFAGLKSSKSTRRNKNAVDHTFLDVPAKFEKSKSGRTWLVDPSGYRYSLNGRNGTKSYWRCPKYLSYRCHSRAFTQGNILKHTYDTHNHTPWDKEN